MFSEKEAISQYNPFYMKRIKAVRKEFPSGIRKTAPFIGFTAAPMEHKPRTFPQGLVVDAVYSGSPAFQVGIQPDDVLLKVGTSQGPITSTSQLDDLVRRHCVVGCFTEFTMFRENCGRYTVPIWIMTNEMPFKGMQYYFAKECASRIISERALATGTASVPRATRVNVSYEPEAKVSAGCCGGGNRAAMSAKPQRTELPLFFNPSATGEAENYEEPVPVDEPFNLTTHVTDEKALPLDKDKELDISPDVEKPKAKPSDAGFGWQEASRKLIAEDARRKAEAEEARANLELASSSTYTREYMERMRAVAEEEQHDRRAEMYAAKPFIGFWLTEVRRKNAPVKNPLVVDAIYVGAPAEQVGIQPNDTLLSFGKDKGPITNLEQMRSLIEEECAVGKVTPATLVRPNGEEYTVYLWVMTTEPQYKGEPYYFETEDARCIYRETSSRCGGAGTSANVAATTTTAVGPRRVMVEHKANADAVAQMIREEVVRQEAEQRAKDGAERRARHLEAERKAKEENDRLREEADRLLREESKRLASESRRRESVAATIEARVKEEEESRPRGEGRRRSQEATAAADAALAAATAVAELKERRRSQDERAHIEAAKEENRRRQEAAAMEAAAAAQRARGEAELLRRQKEAEEEANRKQKEAEEEANRKQKEAEEEALRKQKEAEEEALRKQKAEAAAKEEEELMALASVSYTQEYMDRIKAVLDADEKNKIEMKDAKPFIGFVLTKMTATDGSDSDEPLLVDEVFEGSPADQVGILPGDALVSFAKSTEPLTTFDQLRSIINERCKAGQMTPATLRRPSGEEYTVYLWMMTTDDEYRGEKYYFDPDTKTKTMDDLAEIAAEKARKEEEEQHAALEAAAAVYTQEYLDRMAAMAQEDATEKAAMKAAKPFIGFSLTKIRSKSDPSGAGRIVVDAMFLGSPADQVGIKPDDTLVRFCKKPVTSLTQMRTLVERLASVGNIVEATLSRSGVGEFSVQLWIMTTEREHSGKAYYFDIEGATKVTRPKGSKASPSPSPQ